MSKDDRSFVQGSCLINAVVIFFFLRDRLVPTMYGQCVLQYVVWLRQAEIGGPLPIRAYGIQCTVLVAWAYGTGY